MAIFAIIPQPTTDAAKLADAITTNYKDSHLNLEGYGWFVSASTSAQDLSQKLGISEGAVGGGIIVEMASYFGRANPNIWSWVKAHLEKSGDG